MIGWQGSQMLFWNPAGKARFAGDSPKIAIAILVIQIPTPGEEVERKAWVNSCFEVMCLGTDICRSDGIRTTPLPGKLLAAIRTHFHQIQ